MKNQLDGGKKYKWNQSFQHIWNIVSHKNVWMKRQEKLIELI